ncbi:caspase family protein [Rhabdochromatium marinum]|uniref:caspase family protein n=1 Tax=Rhabdochromatium marinum TaxID=48729 RepID=UPI00190504A5|nr:caspase family protein [Rhabdochromatium marinum]MBK1649833.1 hypothetical protein [Rhabdochromatium marinum]
MTRKALLLGIDAYEEDTLRLAAAARDVPELAKALVLAGFDPAQVQSVVGGEGPYLSTANLRKQIKGLLADARRGDEVLVYFSGHGIEQAGRRLLLPQDFDAQQPANAAAMIGDTSLYELARSEECGADSVIFVIDACRNDSPPATLIAKSGLAASPAEPNPSAETPSIAFLFSCGTGEVSLATDGDEAMSFFTHALCEALTADDDLSTLDQLRQAVQERLNEALRPMAKQQTVTLGELKCTGRGGEPLALMLKDNPATRLRQRIERSRWVRCIEDGALLRMVAAASDGLVIQLRALITEAEDLCRTQREALPAQRWSDDAMPARAVQRLELLLDQQPEPWLTPAEAAIAIAIPHLYEAILAAAEQRLQRDGNPLALDGYAPESSRMALALRNRFASEAAHGRRRELLQRRGLDAAADDLAAWQMLRFLHESGELWDYASGGASNRSWLGRALDSLFAPAPMAEVSADHRVPRVLDGCRLVALARLAFAGFDDIQLEANRERGRQLERDRCFGEGRAQWCVDEVKLAHLANLAFGLALDARRLPALLAEHLGVDPLVTAESLRATLGTGEWHRNGDGLSLRLDCPHEALDAALETHVRDLDEHLSRLGREQVLSTELLVHLPRRLDENVSPPCDDDVPRFARPHLSFTLDQARVRELLMGENLYGDPALALRELYQNALDACRYRRTRERWLRHERRLDDQQPSYKGLISFRAGSANGRAYLECEDNGIGMTERHLRGLFAKAGRRFADSHEFHLEQANWDAASIPFFPNSRFGIGVFSYFMLADEVVVESRRLDADGIDREPGIRARIVGSGSLFRLQPFSGEPRGTRIRLYLNRSDLDPAKLLDGITDWLWVPEFDVEIDGRRVFRMPAGEPGPVMMRKCGPLIPIPESAGDAGQVRVWWGVGLVQPQPVQHFRLEAKFQLMSDGIATAHESGDEAGGLVINLCEQWQASLSVERNKIILWTEAATWVRCILRDYGWLVLRDRPEFALATLGELLEKHPSAIYRLDRELRAGRGTEGGRPWVKNREKVSDTVGLFEADLLIQSSYDPEPRGSGPPVRLKPTATGLLRGRSKALKARGFRASAPFDALARFDTNLEDPVIGAWTLLTRFLTNLKGTNSGIFTPASPLDVYCAVNATATQLEITRSEAATIARSLGTFGIQLDDLNEASALPPLTEVQLRLLSLKNDGRAPWSAVITPACIICSSVVANITVEEMHAQAESLTHLVQAVPELAATSALRDHLTQIQVALLNDRYYPLAVTGDLSITRLARVAKRLHAPIRQVVAEARPLLGDVVQAQQAERLALLATLPETAVDLLGEVNLNPNLWTGRLHAGRLIAKALAQPIPLEQVINDARPLADLGIEIPRLNPAGDVEAADQRCLKLLSPSLNADHLYRNNVDRGQLLRAAVEWSISVERVREIAVPLSSLNVEVADINAMNRSIARDEALVLALQPLDRYIDWGCGRLDPWWLASCCVERNKDPTDFRKPLELLQAFGIDADECLRFTDFCADEDTGSTG